MPKDIKTCSGCKHFSRPHFHGSDVCNLYNKYTVAARIQCKMECWKPRPKENVKIVGDKIIVK